MTRGTRETPARTEKRSAPAADVAPLRVTLRELIGSPRSNGGALMIERHSRWLCDLCGKQRRIVATVLVPFVRGHSRPRFDMEAQPTVTFCWRCLLRKMLAISVRRAPKVSR